MIAVRTPSGSKMAIPRGIMLPDGSLKAFARVAIRAASGDGDLWDSASYSGLTVAVEPAYAYGALAVPSAITATTNSVTAAATGAVGPVAWSWVKTAGDSSWSAVSPSEATTAFRHADTDPDGIEVVATFEVTATDGIGQTGTATVEAIALNYGGYA